MNQIILKDHGILPGTECTLALAELFRAHPADTEFVFEEGDYYFLPKILRDLRLSNTDVLPVRKLGVVLDHMRNVRLTGRHTRLLFGGQMQAVTMKALNMLTEQDGGDLVWLSDASALEQKIDDMTEQYRREHLQRMRVGLCTEEGCILYSELLTDFERIGDHMLNIAQAKAAIRDLD